MSAKDRARKLCVGRTDSSLSAISGAIIRGRDSNDHTVWGSDFRTRASAGLFGVNAGASADVPERQGRGQSSDPLLKNILLDDKSPDGSAWIAIKALYDGSDLSFQLVFVVYRSNLVGHVAPLCRRDSTDSGARALLGSSAFVHKLWKVGNVGRHESRYP
jgi:hypothetical protein